MISGDETENAEAEKVLEQLKKARRFAGGLGHPSDDARAEMLFRRVIDRGARIDPEACYHWAVINGWEADEAKDLAAVVETLVTERP